MLLVVESSTVPTKQSLAKTPLPKHKGGPLHSIKGSAILIALCAITFSSCGNLFGGKVGDIAVEGIYLNKTSISVVMGSTASLKATVFPETAENKNVEWKSNNTLVATVSAGVVTPVALGKATITATTVEGEKAAICQVTVSDAAIAVTSIALSPSTLTLNVAGASMLAATISPADATEQDLTWSSSDESVVTVTSAGRVAPVGQGTATITATSVDRGLTATCSVGVKASPISVGGYINVSTYVNERGVQGYLSSASDRANSYLNTPTAIIGDSSGDIYFFDSGNYIIRKVDSSGTVSAIAGTQGASGYSGDGGQAVGALLGSKIMKMLIREGDLYFADATNYRIRKVDLDTGIISTIAGTGSVADYSDPDGTAVAEAELGAVASFCFDSLGNMYIAEDLYIYELLAKTGRVWRVAGVANNGTYLFDSSTSLAKDARVGAPTDLLFDGNGDLLFSTNGTLNAGGEGSLIQKIVRASGLDAENVPFYGTLETMAGAACGYAGDGGAASGAQFNNIVALFRASSGVLFVVDQNNELIRAIGLDGVVSSIVGRAGTMGYADGALSASLLNAPYGVYVNDAGLMYLTDSNNQRIRLVN